MKKALIVVNLAGFLNFLWHDIETLQYIQNPGHSLDLNPIKIRKLLITKGVYFPSTAAKLFCCSSKGKRTFTLVT